MIRRILRALALRLFARLPIDVQFACALRCATENGYRISRPTNPETIFSDRESMFLRRQA